jgi:hypothetical protein
MRCSGAVRLVAGAMLTFACLALPRTAWSGDVPPAVQAVTDSSAADLGVLASQMHELQAAVGELRKELAAARREAQELRTEIQNARSEPSDASAVSPAFTRAAALKPAGLTPQTAQPEELAPSEPATVGSRVAALEEDHRLLDTKVATQYQTKVESGSKYRVRLSGMALLNASTTRGAVDSIDLPLLARARTPLETGGSSSANVRQSMFGVEVFGPSMGGARVSGDMQFDFFGGFPGTLDGVAAGLVRMRTARVSLDWPHASVVAGQEAPFFSPLSPTSLASMAYPVFSYSGNLWTWTPQIRAERRFTVTENSIFILQAGLLDPLTGELPTSQSYRSPQAGEKSRSPAYATRTAWTHSAFGRELMLGVGGYYARQNWGFDRTVSAWAATADWNVPLAPWLSLSGEFYRGKAIGGLGGGTGRSVVFNGSLTEARTAVVGLDTIGGWSQLNFRPLEKLEFNAAYGNDSPFNSDLRRYYTAQSYIYSSVGRNQSGMFNVIYHARSNLLFSFEYRRLSTDDTAAGRYTADHFNIGAGVLF